MSFADAYHAALEAIGRPQRELKPIYPQGWQDSARPLAMLVLIEGRELPRDDWPAVALVFSEGAYALGHTIPGAAFPRTPELPKIFEGHQCFFEVGDVARITKDVSTNGTLVVPSTEARKFPRLRQNPLLKEWNAPCPRIVRAHDVVVTVYAELLFVPLR